MLQFEKVVVQWPREIQAIRGLFIHLRIEVVGMAIRVVIRMNNHDVDLEDFDS